MITSRRGVRGRAHSSCIALSTFVALGALAMAERTAHAAELLPCRGTEIDLVHEMMAHTSDDGITAPWANVDDGELVVEGVAIDAIFPGGSGDDPISMTVGANGYLQIRRGGSLIGSVEASGDIDLGDGGTWTMCADATDQRLAFTWRDARRFDSGPERVSFQLVFHATPQCAGAASELRFETLEWQLHAGIWGLQESVLLASDSATLLASSNVGEPGVYRGMLCPTGCGNGHLEQGETCDVDAVDAVCPDGTQGTPLCNNDPSNPHADGTCTLSPVPIGCSPIDPCADGGCGGGAGGAGGAGGGGGSGGAPTAPPIERSPSHHTVDSATQPSVDHRDGDGGAASAPDDDGTDPLDPEQSDDGSSDGDGDDDAIDAAGGCSASTAGGGHPAALIGLLAAAAAVTARRRREAR